MFAICIESSHTKGMGHLFRMLNFAKFLNEQNEKYIFLINNDAKSIQILQQQYINFEIVSLEDLHTNWEAQIIQKYSITYWINDRLNTKEEHAQHIKKIGTHLITFDDLGNGATLSDLNVLGLFFSNNNLSAKKLLKGTDYLILNSEIDIYKKERFKLNRILVTLGGSDTYGITLKVLHLLKRNNIKATIHIGPSFAHKTSLYNKLTKEYKVITQLPSLIKEFSHYSLVITGGGITPYEANASGLPSLIIANEIFEIENGKYLDKIGSSKFIGFHNEIDETIFKNLNLLDIQKMSNIGMKYLNTQAANKIYHEVTQL